MNKQEARALCNEIKRRGIRCTVAQKVPASVRVRIDGESLFFESRAAWIAFVKAERQKILDFCAAHGIGTRPRSPIEAIIDKACGVEER